ncbi:MAG TPA: HD domain-containing protein [Acidimicrobiales bacterium]|jgi:(p)ppGpp synthase/HD superfamily hydrolase|nr:HD domain-containing protein [Acidimicrobiales bacterium]
MAETVMGRNPRDMALLQQAIDYVGREHADDLRKGTNIPYVAHLWSVGALVLEHGGDDHQAAAGLLHDVVEDHGGQRQLDRVRATFGDDIADIVAALSDSLADTEKGDQKPPWDVRKQTYLAHLGRVDERIALVSACDKLHNLRAIVSDYREIGPQLWDRFKVHDPAKHLWYYTSLVDTLAPKVAGQAPGLAVELIRSLDDLRTLLATKEPGSLAAPWSPDLA